MRESAGGQMGSDGSVVVPASIRARHQWIEGSTLIALETELGVLLADQESTQRIIRGRLAEVDMVSDLLADRRREAAAD